jgi:hypothetical protein
MSLEYNYPAYSGCVAELGSTQEELAGAWGDLFRYADGSRLIFVGVEVVGLFGV